MSSNKRLVPTCIIYIDGVRINTACEGAFRSVHVTDTLNKVGKCRICFDRTELTEADIKNFTLGSRVSVHLGYKDDLNEVFDGEITVKYVRYEPNNQAVFEVTVLSCLHRLNHGSHCRSFERKTPSQAVKEILALYNLRADCDDFGREFPFWSCEKTDLEHILALAGKYGRDIHAIGEKVYVKQLMTHKKDDIIYEWGKSLISFDAKASIKEQTKEITILGWDKLKGEGFRNSGKIGELTQRVGGKKDWSKVSRARDEEWVETIFDNSVYDMAEAKELALAKLREKSFKFITAEGKGEGNSKLFPGMYVTVKYVGGFSGDYIADSVMHEFDVYSGYTTEFYLKRNMVDEEFKKSRTMPMDMRTGRTAEKNNTAAPQTDGDNGAYYEKEDVPEFRGLKWLKGGKETGEALVDDEVKLICEVKNIDEGATVKLKIFEQGENGDDPIDEVEGIVKDGKVEALWKVDYKENKNCKQEIEEQGYTIPDYYFIADYAGVESEDSKLLYAKDWHQNRLLNKKTKEPLANVKYVLTFSDGTEIHGTTDESGYMKTKHIMCFVDSIDIKLEANDGN